MELRPEMSRQALVNAEAVVAPLFEERSLTFQVSVGTDMQVPCAGCSSIG